MITEIAAPTLANGKSFPILSASAILPAFTLPAVRRAKPGRYAKISGVFWMLGLSAGVVLQISLIATGAQPYNEAQKSASETGQPLLVLVGADWCPGCRTMKHSVMTRMESRGSLAKVDYAIVNTDADPGLAG